MPAGVGLIVSPQTPATLARGTGASSAPQRPSVAGSATVAPTVGPAGGQAGLRSREPPGPWGCGYRRGGRARRGGGAEGGREGGGARGSEPERDRNGLAADGLWLADGKSVGGDPLTVETQDFPSLKAPASDTREGKGRWACLGEGRGRERLSEGDGGLQPVVRSWTKVVLKTDASVGCLGVEVLYNPPPSCRCYQSHTPLPQTSLPVSK